MMAGAPPQTYAHRWAFRFGWWAWALTVLLFVGDLVLLLADGPVSPEDPTVPYLAAEDLAFVLVATLALVIMRSQPGNKVGWWIMVAGVSWPLQSFFTNLTYHGLDTWGKTALVTLFAWVVRWVWIGGQVNIPLTLLYYPDGELPTRKWRGVEIGIWLLILATVFMAVFSPGALPEFPGVQNPVAITALAPFDGSNTISMVLFVGINVLPLVGLISLAARYWHASRVVRLQLKLIGWVAVVSAVFFFVLSTSRIDVSPSGQALLDIGFTLFVVGMVTASIVRFGLFDIDRLISRTVSYAVVVGVLAAIYFGLVAILTGFLPSDKPLVVASSTLAVAALFNPVRRRVQAAVDRRFNRSRYNSERVMDEFAGTLNGSVDPVAVLDGWVSVVAETMHPTSVGIWVREMES
jgi:hypothetical protein